MHGDKFLTMKDLELSDESRKELDEIRRKVDVMLRPLDDVMKQHGFTAEDIIWANGRMYVLDKKNGEKIYIR
jgi:hypothetical protein